jgi:hypothetical protein
LYQKPDRFAYGNKKKQVRLGIPALIHIGIKKKRPSKIYKYLWKTIVLPDVFVHCVHFVPHITAWFSMVSNRVFLNSFTQNACSGREKEASVLASEASADLSDFLTSPRPFPFRRGRRLMVISVPFARENLHLVISLLE